MDDLHRVFSYTSLSYQKARVFLLKVPLSFVLNMGSADTSRDPGRESEHEKAAEPKHKSRDKDMGL